MNVSRGFSAITAVESEQLGKNDEEQMAYGVGRQKTIVTHNRTDFEALVESYFREGRTHYGVIIAVRRSPYEIAERLVEILNQVTADEMLNQVYYI